MLVLSATNKLKSLGFHSIKIPLLLRISKRWLATIFQVVWGVEIAEELLWHGYMQKQIQFL